MTGKMLFAAAVALLLTGSLAWKADAAMVNGVSSLPPLVHSYSPVEAARCAKSESYRRIDQVPDPIRLFVAHLSRFLRP